MKSWKMLVLFILICQLAGIVGSVFTTPAIPTWYAGISKPDFTPPNWLFAPAWTTLFLLMGVALYLIWEKGFKKNRIAVYVFAAQLILNIIWSLLFFGLQNPFFAFVEIIILWIAILATIILFCRVRKEAGIILIPYIAWVSFAALLNYSVWMLNV
jgi:benzodiazapine receptor